MSNGIPRRSFLLGSVATCVYVGLHRTAAADTAAQAKQGATVLIETFSPAGESLGKVEMKRVVKTDDEWKQQLPKESYTVTRHEGTERPFSGKYANNHDAGVYQCICCATALFNANTKFDSGTGWPSFWQPISKLNVLETSDNSFFMRRTAVSCSRCNAHLGHVFNDGPRPTGLRYCMNSVALNFIAKT